MRTSLWQSLLENLARNLRHQQDSVRLYEIGRVYLPDAEGGQGGAAGGGGAAGAGLRLWGPRAARTWTEKDAQTDFFDAKGAVETVLAAVHVDGATFHPAETAPLHPRATAEVRAADGQAPGWVGELHPRSAKALGLPEGIQLFSLDLEALTRRPSWSRRTTALQVPGHLPGPGGGGPAGAAQ